MADGTWEALLVKDLAQHHVGRLVRVNWSDAKSATGTLSVLRFARRTTFYENGKSETGPRTCQVVLEIADSELQLELGLMSKVEVLI